MSGLIRKGDLLTSGGKVIGGSDTRLLKGKGVACLGDAVSCPLHGSNRIVEATAGLTVDGKPAAQNGDRCGCGCCLITSLPESGLL